MKLYYQLAFLVFLYCPTAVFADCKTPERIAHYFRPVYLIGSNSDGQTVPVFMGREGPKSVSEGAMAYDATLHAPIVCTDTGWKVLNMTAYDPGSEAPKPPL